VSRQSNQTAVRLPDFVEPMKAQLVDSIRPGDWLYEIKFDGYRALALRGGHETRILSRNQKDLGKKFPEITDSIAGLDIQDAVIDGEIVALDDKGRSSFQLLQGFDMGMVRPPIVFHAFDLLRLNGEDLRGLPIEERKAKLAALLRPPPPAIRYSASFTENIAELLNKVRELSLEGLIGKRAGSNMTRRRVIRRGLLQFPWAEWFDFEFPEFGKNGNHCRIRNTKKDTAANSDEGPTKAFEHGMAFQIAV
jgi:ATP-dependent DNA ligase